MPTMNISLPDSLRTFVGKRVASGHYGTSSEYVRELIRKDEARLALARLIREGLASPSVGRPDAEYWATKRRHFLKQP